MLLFKINTKKKSEISARIGKYHMVGITIQVLDILALFHIHSSFAYLDPCLQILRSSWCTR